MKFSLETTATCKPSKNDAVQADNAKSPLASPSRARLPLPGENLRARTDASGTSASAYLKTAAKANEAGNYRREAELLEKAILAMGNKLPNVLRRYAAALYKIGEYRAAWLIITDPKALEDGGEGYVSRLKDKLKTRADSSFMEILTFS